MQESSIEALQAYLPQIIAIVFGPVLAHILYALLGISRPKLALYLISITTIVWMFFAASITYGPPFGPTSKMIFTLYSLLAVLILWFAHHKLIKRANLTPNWLYHSAAIMMFGAYGLLFYKYHISWQINPPIHSDSDQFE